MLWPAYFNVYDFALCRDLAARLRYVVSTVHVYDGDYWEHLFLDGTNEIHKFSSYPTYFAKTAAEAEQFAAEWRGDPKALASLLQIPCERISGYLAHLPLEPAPADQPVPQPAERSWLQKLLGSRPATTPPQRPVRKAYPTDEFGIEDFWVFIDFWRQLGITYPDPVDQGIHSILRFDDIHKLPHAAD